MKANKPETRWCVKHKPSGHYHIYTLSYQKKDAIKYFVSESRYTWEQFRRQHGYTCEKVTVTINPFR